MNEHDDWTIRLLELKLGLLEPEEELALRSRITTDADLARKWQQVVQQSEILKQACRIEQQQLDLDALIARADQETADHPDHVQTNHVLTAESLPPTTIIPAEPMSLVASATTVDESPSPRNRRWSAWLPMACSLVLLASLGWLVDRQLISEIKSRHQAVSISLPTRVLASVQQVPAEVSAVDKAGAPVRLLAIDNATSTNTPAMLPPAARSAPPSRDQAAPAQVSAATNSATTDRVSANDYAENKPKQPRGYGSQPTTEGESVSKRFVEHDSLSRNESFFGRLADFVAPPQSVNVAGDLGLTDRLVPAPARSIMLTDRTSYRAGETVYARSLLARRDSSQPVPEQPIDLSLVSPTGATHQAIKTKTDAMGIAIAQFTLPAEAAAGNWVVQARPQSDVQAWAELPVQVIQTNPAPFEAAVTFDKPRYLPGDEVRARVRVVDRQQQILDRARLSVAAKLQDKTLTEQSQLLDDKGEALVQLKLPADAKAQDSAGLAFGIDKDGTRQFFQHPIPLATSDLAVQLIPESGSLVAGVENRVYFMATTPAGDPVDLAGRVVDRSGDAVAQFKSDLLGMGRFKFTPRESAEYQVDAAPQASQLGTVNVKSNVLLAKAGVGFSLPNPVISSKESIRVDCLTSPNQLQQRQGTEALFELRLHDQTVSKQLVRLTKPTERFELPIPQLTQAELHGLFHLLMLQRPDPAGQANADWAVVAQRQLLITPSESLRVNLGLSADQGYVGQAFPFQLSVHDQANRSVASSLGLRVVDSNFDRWTRRPPLRAMTQFFSYLDSRKPLPVELFEQAKQLDTSSESGRSRIDLTLMTHALQPAPQGQPNRANASANEYFMVNSNLGSIAREKPDQQNAPTTLRERMDADLERFSDREDSAQRSVREQSIDNRLAIARETERALQDYRILRSKFLSTSLLVVLTGLAGWFIILLSNRWLSGHSRSLAIALVVLISAAAGSAYMFQIKPSSTNQPQTLARATDSKKQETMVALSMKSPASPATNSPKVGVTTNEPKLNTGSQDSPQPDDAIRSTNGQLKSQSIALGGNPLKDSAPPAKKDAEVKQSTTPPTKVTQHVAKAEPKSEAAGKDVDVLKGNRLAIGQAKPGAGGAEGFDSTGGLASRGTQGRGSPGGSPTPTPAPVPSAMPASEPAGKSTIKSDTTADQPAPPTALGMPLANDQKAPQTVGFGGGGGGLGNAVGAKDAGTDIKKAKEKADGPARPAATKTVIKSAAQQEQRSGTGAVPAAAGLSGAEPKPMPPVNPGGRVGEGRKVIATTPSTKSATKIPLNKSDPASQAPPRSVGGIPNPPGPPGRTPLPGRNMGGMPSGGSSPPNNGSGKPTPMPPSSAIPPAPSPLPKPMAPSVAQSPVEKGNQPTIEPPKPTKDELSTDKSMVADQTQRQTRGAVGRGRDNQTRSFSEATRKVIRKPGIKENEFADKRGATERAQPPATDAMQPTQPQPALQGQQPGGGRRSESQPVAKKVDAAKTEFSLERKAMREGGERGSSTPTLEQELKARLAHRTLTQDETVTDQFAKNVAEGGQRSHDRSAGHRFVNVENTPSSSSEKNELRASQSTDQSKTKQAALTGKYLYRSPTTGSGPSLAPTLLWDPAVFIPATKEPYQVSLQLADQETAYRGEIIAHDALGRFGFAEFMIPATLPAQIELQAPTQLIAGDEFDAELLVSNRSNEEIVAELQTKLPAGWSMIKPPTQMVRVPGKGSVTTAISLRAEINPPAASKELAQSAALQVEGRLLGGSDLARADIMIAPLPAQPAEPLARKQMVEESVAGGKSLQFTTKQVTLGYGLNAPLGGVNVAANQPASNTVTKGEQVLGTINVTVHQPADDITMSLGIPAGLLITPAQLQELSRHEAIKSASVTHHHLVLSLKSGIKQPLSISFRAQARFVGRFQFPASTLTLTEPGNKSPTTIALPMNSANRLVIKP